MTPLEQLFRFEVEFHRRLRTEAPGTGDARGVHTSYALQSGYENLIRSLGTVTRQDMVALQERLTLAGDTRDVMSARDSVMTLLGIRLVET
jgi:hypothetical protein